MIAAQFLEVLQGAVAAADEALRQLIVNEPGVGYRVADPSTGDRL